jgi:hypothetical protein
MRNPEQPQIDSTSPSGVPAVEGFSPSPGSAWSPISTAPKDGHAIIALLPDSDLPHTIRWRVDGWEIAWDQSPLGQHDQPQWWMPIPPPPNAALSNTCPEEKS